MSPALAHALLALAVLALGAAAMRAASTLAPSGLERVLAAVMMPSSAVLNAVSDLELPAGPLERCDYDDRPLVDLAQRLAIYRPRPALTASDAERPR